MKRLLDVPVVQVMTSHPAAIELEATVGDAAGTMVEGGFRHLPVIDADHRVLGVVSDRDLRERLGVDVERFPEAAPEVLEDEVERVMRPDPVTLEANTARLRDVLDILVDERVGAIPVLDGAERLVGIVSYVDVVQFLREQDAVLSVRAAPRTPRRALAARTKSKQSTGTARRSRRPKPRAR